MAQGTAESFAVTSTTWIQAPKHGANLARRLTAWIQMAEKVTSLRRRGDGSLPLDKALNDLQADPTVMFHLVPMPIDKAHAPAPKPSDTKRDEATKPLNIRKKDKVKGKGRGKGSKGKLASKGRMPTELIGLHQQDKAGRRMCYNFNLSKGCEFAAVGQQCSKGVHSCMR